VEAFWQFESIRSLLGITELERDKKGPVVASSFGIWKVALPHNDFAAPLYVASIRAKRREVETRIGIIILPIVVPV